MGSQLELPFSAHSEKSGPLLSPSLIEERNAKAINRFSIPFLCERVSWSELKSAIPIFSLEKRFSEWGHVFPRSPEISRPFLMLLDRGFSQIRVLKVTVFNQCIKRLGLHTPGFQLGIYWSQMAEEKVSNLDPQDGRALLSPRALFQQHCFC